ncbi:MAG: transcription antitermination factor NusB [Candidatus Omnitrophica bacterium]|nr:transcription antitermination factor NusB [Candidatus Omnitrophota bacterium]
MRKRTRARELALQILYQMDIRQGDVNEILADFWAHNEVPKDVHDFSEKLAQGVLTHQKLIDKIIRDYAENWSLNRMAVIDRNIIRMAAFELLYMDDIPPKVSINEAVDLAKKFGDEQSGSFVNGILDKIFTAEVKGAKQRGG